MLPATARPILAGLLGLAFAFGATVSGAQAQESYTNRELSDLASQKGKPFVIAKFRRKVITATGELEKFVDTGIGSKVWAVMDLEGGGYAVLCSFPRSDEALYDRLANMAKGTPVTFQGTFADLNDAFYHYELEPCSVL